MLSPEKTTLGQVPKVPTTRVACQEEVQGQDEWVPLRRPPSHDIAHPESGWQCNRKADSSLLLDFGDAGSGWCTMDALRRTACNVGPVITNMSFLFFFSHAFI